MCQYLRSRTFRGIWKFLIQGGSIAEMLTTFDLYIRLSALHFFFCFVFSPFNNADRKIFDFDSVSKSFHPSLVIYNFWKVSIGGEREDKRPNFLKYPLTVERLLSTGPVKSKNLGELRIKFADIWRNFWKILRNVPKNLGLWEKMWRIHCKQTLTVSSQYLKHF